MPIVKGRGGNIDAQSMKYRTNFCKKIDYRFRILATLEGILGNEATTNLDNFEKQG